MISPDLLRFIRSRQNEGMSRENITRRLIEDGDWTREDIDEAFHAIGNEGDGGNDTENGSENTQSYVTEDETQHATQSSPDERMEAFQETPQDGIHSSSNRPAASGSSAQGRPSSPAPFIIAALLLVLGGAGVAAAFFGDTLPFIGSSEQPPEDIVERMFEASAETTSQSFSMEGTASVTAPGDSVPAMQQGGSGEAPDELTINSSFSVNGSAEITSDATPIGSNTISFSLEEANGNPIAMGVSNLSAELETRTLEDTLYVNLVEAPDLGFFSLAPFEDQWIAIEMSDAQGLGGPQTQFSPGDIQTYLEEYQETAESLFALNEEHQVVQISYEGTERIEGEQTFHYHVELEEENAYDFLVAAHEEFSDSANTGDLPSETEVEEAFAILGDVTADFHVSTGDYLPIRLVIQSSFEDAENDVSGEGSFVMTFSDYNEPVNIEAPENSRPIEEVMQEMFGGMMNSSGSGMGGSTMQGGGGGGMQQPTQ